MHASDHKVLPKATSLVGKWCVMSMEGNGIRVPENIELRLQRGGRYQWVDGAFTTEGQWEVDQSDIYLSSVGRLPAAMDGHDGLRLHPPRATWHLKRGGCRPDGVSQQTVVAFQNAAGSGDLEAMRRMVANGVAADVQDFVSGDTALILAAKFCREAVAKALLDSGANPTIRNLEGLRAADYVRGAGAAKRSCPALQAVLR